MQRAEVIDIVQTIGIIFIGLVVAYVVYRIEQQFKAWFGTLSSVDKQLREQAGLVKQQAATLEALNTIWARINAIEKHLGLRKNNDDLSAGGPPYS